MPLDQEQWRWVHQWPVWAPAIGVPSGGVTSARPNAALMSICWCPGALVVVVASVDFANGVVLGPRVVTRMTQH
jgi:hypothetical protein